MASEEERDQAEDEGVEHDRLGQGEPEPLDRGDLVAHLGLTGHRLDDLAEDEADADARSDGAQSGTHAEGDGLHARLDVTRGTCLREDRDDLRGETHLRCAPLLVVLGDCAAEVDRREGGEDERLQGRHQADLEDEERDRDRQRDDAERSDAEDDHEAAAHEQDEQVAGEDVGEQSDAEADDADDVRDRLDDEQDRAHRVRRPGRDPAREVLAEALGPDAGDVVREPHDEREGERDRDVRRRRVDRELRYRDPEHVEGRVRVRRQRDVADEVGEPDEQEERPDEREPLPRHRVVHVAARDVVAHEQVERLDRGLHAVGPLLHPARDVEHAERREHRRDREVEHRAGDREVDAGEVDADPVLELELLLRLERLVAAGRAGERADDPREHEHATDRSEDLDACAHGVWTSPGPLDPGSNGRRIIFVVNQAVNRTTDSTAADRPTSSSVRSPTDTRISAMSHPRPIIEPVAMPTTRLGPSPRRPSCRSTSRCPATWPRCRPR